MRLNEWSTLERNTMDRLSPSARFKLPFLLAGFMSFLFSVWLYFVQGETTAGIFVGLWVPSIHSLGSLLLSPVEAPAARTLEEVVS